MKFGNLFQSTSEKADKAEKPPAADHDQNVLMTKRVDMQNLIISIAAIFTICVYSINFTGVTVSAFANNSVMQDLLKLQTIAQTLLICFIFFLIGHRVVGYILGLILRVVLRKSFQAASDGKFEIYIGWVSYRGFLDRNQLVISNIMWLNPPEFRKSPYLLRCRELSVSFNFWDMVDTIRYLKAIKFEEIVIDSLEVYFERVTTDSTENSLNIWAAIGVKDKDSEKSMLRGVIMGIWQAIINRMKKPFSQSEGSNIDYDLLDGEDTLNEDATVVGDESVTEDEPKSPRSLAMLKKTESGNKKTPLPTVEFHRLLVVDLRAHPLDLLASKHSSVGYKKSNNIYIKLFYMHRHDVTGKPRRKGGPRVALPADEFGDKFGDAFGAALVSNNPLSIGSMLAATAVTNTVYKVTNVGNLIRETFVGSE